MKLSFRKSVLLILFMVVIIGCATTQKSLEPEQAAKIKQIIVLLTDAGPEARIFDYTGMTGQSQVRKSIGGDPDILLKSVSDIPIKKLVYSKLLDKLAPTFLVVRIYSETNDGPAKAVGNSTVLKIRLVHGLAAHAGEPASAAIEAKVEVLDSTGECLIRTWLQSDKLFRKGRRLVEFNDDNAQLYKADLGKAVDSIAIQIASLMGIESQASGNAELEGQCSTIDVTCSYPYRLTQDCSGFSGAKRQIQLGGQKLKIAGTLNGKIILIMNSNYVANEMTRALTKRVVNNNPHQTLECLEVVEKYLLENDIHIMKRVRMLSYSGGTDGFFLELDNDGYSILKQHTIP